MHGTIHRDRRRRHRRPGAVVGGVAAWALLLLVANRWGQALLDGGVGLRIHAPPLIGRFQLGPDRGFGPLVLVAPMVAAGLILAVPRARALPWRPLLVAAAAAAALWAVSLALVSGWSWIARPMELPGHYLLDVERVGPPGAFLTHFTERIDGYGVHVRAHPPGFVLILWVLDRVGLGGGGWAAALAIVGGAAAVPAVLVAVRETAGESPARTVVPFLVLAPAALYVATTADAFFAGVGAWAVALVVLATGPPGPRSDRLALGGGVLFGCTALLSYGLVLLGTVPLAVAVSRRRGRPLVVAAAGAGAVLGAAGLAGFWWVEGLLATRVEYRESVAAVRPYGYFLVANLAALAVVVGPATAAGLARLRSGGLGPLVAGALAAVALADLSGLSKGEVERIWLPFAVWLLPAASAVLDTGRRSPVPWLAAQAGVALAVQIGVRTHW